MPARVLLVCALLLSCARPPPVVRSADADYLSFLTWESADPKDPSGGASGRARDVTEVDIFPDRTTERPALEAGRFVFQEGNGPPPFWIDRLRHAAAQRGCDGVTLGRREHKAKADKGSVLKTAYFGTCLIYKFKN